MCVCERERETEEKQCIDIIRLYRICDILIIACCKTFTILLLQASNYICFYYMYSVRVHSSLVPRLHPLSFNFLGRRVGGAWGRGYVHSTV